MRKSIFSGATAVFLAVLPWASASGATVAASTDTFITISQEGYSGPNSNYGAAPTLAEIGPYPFYAYPLITFNLSGFAGQTVVGPASLSLNVVGTWGNNTVSQSLEAFQVLVPWGESTVTWTNFGPGPIFGTNVAATALAPLSNITVSAGSVVTFSIPATLLQEWINNPSTNDGLLLVSTTGTDDLDIQFASTRSTVVSGPELSFNTTSIPEPSTIMLVACSALAVLGNLLRQSGERRRIEPCHSSLTVREILNDQIAQKVV